MRLNNFLILLSTFVVVSTFLIGLIKSEQYILFEQFEYQNTCASLNDSTSSSTTPMCDSATLLNGQLIKESICLGYNGIGGLPSMFTVSADSKVVTQSIYNNNDTLCQGQVIQTINTSVLDCIENCEPNEIYGQTYQFSLIDEINIPSNTFVSIWYSGECLGEFKDTFVSIYFQVLNRCEFAASVDLISSYITCNSTDLTGYAFPNGQESCSGTPNFSRTQPLENICGEDPNLNLLQVCNK